MEDAPVFLPPPPRAGADERTQIAAWELVQGGQDTVQVPATVPKNLDKWHQKRILMSHLMEAYDVCCNDTPR